MAPPLPPAGGGAPRPRPRTTSPRRRPTVQVHAASCYGRRMTMQEARSFAPARHEAILRVLAETGSAVSADLAMRLGVSMDTVRRDLAELEAAGHLQRVHGGAVRAAPGPRRFVDRLAGGDEAKGVVAALA